MDEDKETSDKRQARLIGLTAQDEQFPEIIYKQVEVKKPIKPDPLALPPNCTPLEGLIAIYRNARLGEGLRFKAMAEAAKYMHAKIAVRADVSASFAERLEQVLERRLARPQATNGMKVIEAKPIEAKPVESFKRRI
jgi:hypothetical protein